MSEMGDWNTKIIEEFRANGGKVGGQFAGAPLLLLTTTGARSGQLRTNPLMYLPDSERYVIFGSKAGAPTNPDWYHNLVANPEATVEVGTDKHRVRAVMTHGSERDDLYARQSELYPGFAEYQAKTARKIPVIALEPVA